MANVLENGDFHAGGASWGWNLYSAAFPPGQHKAVVQEGRQGSQSYGLFFYDGPHFQVPRGSDWRLRFHVKKIAANPVHGLGTDHWTEEFFVSMWTFGTTPATGFEIGFTPWPGLDVPPGAEADFDFTATLRWGLGFPGTLPWRFGVRGPGGFGIGDPNDWGYGYELSNFSLEQVGGGATPAWVDFLVQLNPLGDIETHSFDFQDYAQPPPPFVKTGWLWDFGDGTTSTVQNPPTHTYPAGGTYYATETVTASDGATTITDSLTKQIYVAEAGGGDGYPGPPPPPPPPPTATWGAFGVTFPGGCYGGALVSWAAPTFSRGPLTLAEVGNEISLPGVDGSANSSNARWVGLGIVRYDVYVDGVLAAHTDATWNFPDGSGYSPPPTSVSVPPPPGGWFGSHHVQVKAIWDDMAPWGYWSPLTTECVPNCRGPCCQEVGVICLEQSQPWNILREGFYPTDYAALGSFGGFGANIPCTLGNCTYFCIPCLPVCQPAPGLTVSTWETIGVPAAIFTFDGPALDPSCSNSTIDDDFETCDGDVVGDATCAEPGFACSGTHVLRCNVPGPIATPGGAELAHHCSYWISPAGAGEAEPNYMSCVLWPNLDWSALPPGYTNEILVLAAIVPTGDISLFDHQPFFGVGLQIQVGDAGDVGLHARGVRGFTGPGEGASWVGFDSGEDVGEVCAGRPNCIELFYEYGPGTTPQQAQAWVNGVDLGASELGFSGAWYLMQQLRAGAVDYRWDGDEPHAFPSALADLSGALWIDDVAYSPSGRSGCACECTGPVYLTRAVSPEKAISSGAEVSGLHLRGVSASAEGGGGSAGTGDPGVQLGGARVKLG